jgi:hypothetical protein
MGGCFGYSCPVGSCPGDFKRAERSTVRCGGSPNMTTQLKEQVLGCINFQNSTLMRAHETATADWIPLD